MKVTLPIGVTMEGSVEEFKQIGFSLETERGTTVEEITVRSREAETIDVSSLGSPFCKQGVIGYTYHFDVKFKDGRSLTSEMYFPSWYLEKEVWGKQRNVTQEIKELFV